MLSLHRIGGPGRGLALAATLALAGCAEAPSRPATEVDATPQAGYGRAFGRVAYREDGKEVIWGMTWTANHRMTLFVRSNRTGEMQSLDLEGTGYFVWPLRPGEYTLLGFQTAQPESSGIRRRTARLMATFAVPQAGQAVYLGELQVEAGKGGNRIRVADKYDEGGLSRFEARPDAGKFQSAKGLMVLEPPPGKFKHVLGICGGGWGIECTNEFRGVEPLAPEGTAHGYPVVAMLPPLLEWKPSSSPGVTYDVAVYESHATTPLSELSAVNSRIRGAIVAYAEGLAEPRFAPTGLMRNRTYEWSVRLRDGDTVSSWSTTSRSTFIIIAASRGSGQFFGFATLPD